ncbi:MAG: hypothetical protein U1E27_11580, partial [Kiritimatiellia bacterium]|nr:hypothetical protein [Kiritimatiellia bacterium]
LDTTDPAEGGQSLKVSKTSGQAAQFVRGDFIPVIPGAKYRISAYARGENIVAGTSGWHRLYIIGRWCDGQSQSLTTNPFPDLQAIPVGTFDWGWFGQTYTAPTNAVYFQARDVGLIDASSSGTGWLDRIEFIRVE